jgi:hypothetical protein
VIIRLKSTKEALAAAGLSGLVVVAVIVDVPNHEALGPLDRSVIRGFLWGALAVSMLLCLRHRSQRTGSIRMLSLAFPTTALLSVAGVVAAMSGSVSASVQILTAPLIVAAFAALVVVPTVLIYFGVSELQETHKSGRWLTELIERRPVMVLVVLAGNLVFVGLLWALDACGTTNCRCSDRTPVHGSLPRSSLEPWCWPSPWSATSVSRVPTTPR